MEATTGQLFEAAGGAARRVPELPACALSGAYGSQAPAWHKHGSEGLQQPRGCAPEECAGTLGHFCAARRGASRSSTPLEYVTPESPKMPLFIASGS